MRKRVSNSYREGACWEISNFVSWEIKVDLSEGFKWSKVSFSKSEKWINFWKSKVFFTDYFECDIHSSMWVELQI